MVTNTNTNHHRRHLVNAVLIATVWTSATAGAALIGAGSASAAEGSVEQTYTINGSDSIKVSLRCPGNKAVDGRYLPYLVNRIYPTALGRVVPRGVDVFENGGVGVTMRGAADWVELKGVYVGAEGTATNWNTAPANVVIKLHCSDDYADAQQTMPTG